MGRTLTSAETWKLSLRPSFVTSYAFWRQRFCSRRRFWPRESSDRSKALLISYETWHWLFKVHGTTSTHLLLLLLHIPVHVGVWVMTAGTRLVAVNGQELSSYLSTNAGNHKDQHEGNSSLDWVRGFGVRWVALGDGGTRGPDRRPHPGGKSQMCKCSSAQPLIFMSHRGKKPQGYGQAFSVILVSPHRKHKMRYVFIIAALPLCEFPSYVAHPCDWAGELPLLHSTILVQK